MKALLREKGGAVRLRSRLDKSGLPFATNPLDGRAGPGLKVFYANFDTLTFWFKAELPWREGLVAVLSGLRTAAEAKPQVYETGPYKWEVMPHGAAGGFSFILRSPLATMLMKRDGACQITLRAVFLAAVGPDSAVEEMTAVVGMLRAKGRFGEPSSPMGILSRCDICVDVGMPVLGYADVENMVSRAKIRTAHGYSLEKGDALTAAHIRKCARVLEKLVPGMAKLDAATAVLRSIGLARVWKTEAGEVATEHQREAVYRRGQHTSGVSIGAGQMVCRIYDKVLEESVTQKGFIKQIWKREGWVDLWAFTGTVDGSPVGGELEADSRSIAAAELGERGVTGVKLWHANPVTRIEFQLRKGALDSFEPIRRGQRRWDSVRPLTGALWAYLTQEWLTLRTPTANLQPTRWPIDPRWADVQTVAFPGARPMRRADLGSPPRWVGGAVEAERASEEDGSPLGVFYRPKPLTASDWDRPSHARVRAEVKRRGMDRPGHRVLRDAERRDLRNIRSQARGLVVSMAAILGGDRPMTSAIGMLQQIPDFQERLRVAEARHVYRGAERLAIGGIG